jgi:hypothetical protein
MILHHMRHGRQDNHATNHVRCTKTQGRASRSIRGLHQPRSVRTARGPMFSGSVAWKQLFGLLKAVSVHRVKDVIC